MTRKLRYGKVRLYKRLESSSSSSVPLLPAGILTQYLSQYVSKEQRLAMDEQCRNETAMRVDIIDAWMSSMSDLWRQFRFGLDCLFTKEFGLRLPPCSKVPSTDLMRHFQKHHIA